MLTRGWQGVGPRVCGVHCHKGSSNLKPSLIVTRFLIFTFICFIMDNSEQVTVPTNLKVYQYFNNYQAKGKKKKKFILSRSLFHHPHCWATFPFFSHISKRRKKESWDFTTPHTYWLRLQSSSVWYFPLC